LFPDSVTGDERLRKMFLFVMVGVDAPVASSASTTRGVPGLDRLIGVDGVVVDPGAPISCTRRRAVKMSSSVNRLNGILRYDCDRLSQIL
jgi:hypothetical protein